MKLEKIELLSLRPTQFVLGMKEIEAKLELIQSFKKSQWIQYRDEHKIPVVLGPDSQVYMIDHHHFARACWELDNDDFRLRVMKDLRHLNDQAFWNFMIQKRWTYLYDQFGMGPHSPEALPSDIRCMSDDPFRSLAWAVRESGGFQKTDIPFFEFQWAAYYRQNLGIVLHSKSDFKDAVKKAMKLSKSKDAAHLPGFKKS